MATKSNKDSGEAEVQSNVDEETEQGFSGTAVDPTPRDNYTLSGVVAGKPTPETDEKAAREAADSLRDTKA